MKTVIAYKLAKPNGFDFYTGETINYRENIGRVVKCPNANPKLGVCSNGVIHASSNPNDCFIGASIPCSAFRIEGKPSCGTKEKYGFTQFMVLEEIFDLDNLFGWNYSEAITPFNPLTRKVKATKADITLLKEWASVRDSVWASVRASVWASVGAGVWDSVGASVWASVGDSVWDSVRASVRDSVGASVRAGVGDSVGDSVWAYVGSLFPNIEKWGYIKHEVGVYPYQAAVDLWKRGLVASFDGELWRLHSGEKADIVFEISMEDLSK